MSYRDKAVERCGTTSISTETLAVMKIRRFKFETVDTVTRRIVQWYAICVTAPIELKGALVQINGEYKWLSVSDRDNAWKAAKQAKGKR